MCHAATVEAYPDGAQVFKWPDPYDEPTPTYVGNYIMTTRSGWLLKHLRIGLVQYKEQMGIHPTHSLEAVSQLGVREKLFKFIVKKRALSYKASSDPPWEHVKPGRCKPEHECPDCGQPCHTAKHPHHHKLSKHTDTYTEGVNIRRPVGIPIRYTLSGNAPVPQKKQANI